ncbi:MAG TPA: penicillin-binding transpeptidase domain-containing protein [Streptosporangiaceae bacterium]|jgi:cell division protein FtsI/penicillin-binding protein 2|nr:penicillin-binding transpeptidase domain-containing protein [Streptosporangiaceae bacterium]
MRARGIRLIAALVSIGVVIAGFIDGFGQEPSPEATVQGFLLAWQQQDYRDAASYTTGAMPVVSAALADAFTQLNATSLFLSMGRIDQHGDTAVAHFSASVNLGAQGRQWTYAGAFTLRRLSSGWKVEWAPSVINPRLGPGERLAVVTKVPPRAPVLNAEGQPLQVPSPVYEVGVWPRSLANPAATASGLARVTGLNSTQVLGQIRAAPPGQFLRLLSLDPGSYAQLAPRLARVPGLRVHGTHQRLFSSYASEIVGTVGTENSSVLRAQGAAYQPGTTVGLTGLEATYQRMLAGSPTTEVVIEDGGGRQVSVLREWQGKAGQPVRTTISRSVQSAALDALGAAPDAAAEIVAVQPSTGKILAVAGHDAPGGKLPAGGALNGRVPPGMAFTIVSAAALLKTGFSAGTEIPCTSVTNVGGELFTGGQLASGLGGNTSFSTDFAQGCRTAFAGLSRRLTSSDFSQVVGGFGIGANWQLPLLSFSGSVPAATGDGQLAAETIGQGVQVSPLAMAMVAAEVQSGVAHSPVLVTSPPNGSVARKSPLSAGALTSLREMMRKAVTSGSAQSADVQGAPVYGQTGLVQTGSGRSSAWDSWFVGFRGNVAFAVLESNQSSQVSASVLAAQFLNALQLSH